MIMTRFLHSKSASEVKVWRHDGADLAVVVLVPNGWIENVVGADHIISLSDFPYCKTFLAIDAFKPQGFDQRDGLPRQIGMRPNLPSAQDFIIATIVYNVANTRDSYFIMATYPRRHDYSIRIFV